MDEFSGSSAVLPHPRPRAWFEFAWWLAALLLALPILAVATPRTDLNPRSRLHEQVMGTAARPYVKRALAGLVVRGADALIPAGARAAFAERVAATPFLVRRLRWDPAHATEFALMFALHLASLLLFAAAFRRLLVATQVAQGATAALGGLAGLALVPIHFGYQNFVYDFPQLALFTLGLVFLFERRWRAYYLLWPIGVLSKETFVLLLPVFALTQWRILPRRAWVLHLAVQLAAFAVVWGALAWAFRDNRGVAFEWHLMRNLTLRPPARQLVHDAIYWGVWLAAFLWWWEKRALAGATLMVGGLLVGFTLFFGFLGEYRDFYEAWPLVAAMAGHTVLRLARRATGRAASVPA